MICGKFPFGCPATMAFSNSRSISRRGSAAGNDGSTTPSRRSQHQAPRKGHRIEDYVNKMDNPLFNASESDGSDGGEEESAEEIRVWSASRTGWQENGRKGIWRRDGSTSRGPFGSNDDSMGINNKEKEQECNLVSTLKHNTISALIGGENKDSNEAELELELSARIDCSQEFSNEHQALEVSTESDNTKWEDAVPANYSEAHEEKVKSDCEQTMNVHHLLTDDDNGEIFENVEFEVRRAVSEIHNDLQAAICRRSPSIDSTTNIADILPELLIPDALSLISDIRQDYTIKLEQSQERVRKLRTDLEAEEQHGQELCKILKKIIGYANVSEVPKSRTRHKLSMERRKISKCLAEDVLHYFDECVSISTFDSSDFSSFEDPSPLPTSVVTLPDNFLSTNHAPNSHLSNYLNNCNKGSEYQTPCSLSICGSNLTSHSSFNSIHCNELLHHCQSAFESPKGVNHHFSLRSEDIKHFIKKFEKGTDGSRRGRGTHLSPNYSAADKYSMKMLTETLLHEKVIHKNRIESGSMVICEIRTF